MSLFNLPELEPTLKQRLQGETNMAFMPYHERVGGRQSFRHQSMFPTGLECNKMNKARAKRKAEKKARKASRAKK